MEEETNEFTDMGIEEDAPDQKLNETPEEKVLLTTIKDEIKRDWKISNVGLINNFFKILEFYGILGEGKKTILEAKGKTIVRKFVRLNCKEQILKILK